MTEHETTNDNAIRYVGFWLRFGASIIDSIMVIMFTYPFLFLMGTRGGFSLGASAQGTPDLIITYVFPFIATILFWVYKSAKPGKILLNTKIIDEKTGNKPTIKQSIIRYLGYYVSLIPLGLGFFWIAWDEKKQGWHDKMAGTVVIHSKT